MDVPPIRSRRLELVSLSPRILEEVLDGGRGEAERRIGARLPDDWPDEHDERWLRRRLDQMRGDPGAQEWLGRALVLPNAERPVIGHAGFHGRPGVNGLQKPAVVEIGYTVFEPFRGHGYATEAALALLEWARAERGVSGFAASVAPDNEPSLAIVRKLGFVHVGEQWDDEDGLELVFELAGSA